MNLTKPEVKKILEICAHDGHGIKAPEAFVGVNKEFMKRVTHKFKSDRSDPKSTIFGNNGEVLDELTGVYSLSALGAACSILKLENNAGTFFGRGRQASAYTEALMKWMEGSA